jgi:hypothetical protein
MTLPLMPSAGRIVSRPPDSLLELKLELELEKTLGVELCRLGWFT